MAGREWVPAFAAVGPFDRLRVSGKMGEVVGVGTLAVMGQI